MERIAELIEPTVQAMGYELVGVEFLPAGHRSTLRVYIDSDSGVDLDDCQQVSHQISGILDVEDPIKGSYTLEVSSPGINRPLFKAHDYERFAGERVKVQLKQPLDGRKNFKGVLKGMQDDFVLIEIDGESWRLPLIQIRKAHLSPEY